MMKLALSSDASHFSQEHVIFGKHYLVEFVWNERENYWMMHLFDGSERPIALGLRVTTEWPIVVDQNADIAFLLVAKHPNVLLTKSSLQSDFILVAYEFV